MTSIQKKEFSCPSFAHPASISNITTSFIFLSIITIMMEEIVQFLMRITSSSAMMDTRNMLAILALLLLWIALGTASLVVLLTKCKTTISESNLQPNSTNSHPPSNHHVVNPRASITTTTTATTTTSTDSLPLHVLTSNLHSKTHKSVKTQTENSVSTTPSRTDCSTIPSSSITDNSDATTPVSPLSLFSSFSTNTTNTTSNTHTSSSPNRHRTLNSSSRNLSMSSLPHRGSFVINISTGGKRRASIALFEGQDNVEITVKSPAVKEHHSHPQEAATSCTSEESDRRSSEDSFTALLSEPGQDVLQREEEGYGSVDPHLCPSHEESFLIPEVFHMRDEDARIQWLQETVDLKRRLAAFRFPKTTKQH